DSDGTTVCQAYDVTTIPLSTISPGTPNYLMQAQNGSNAASGIRGSGHLTMRNVVAALADASIQNSEVTLWLDDTPGATKLMVKAKDSGGTVRSAAIALT